MIPIPQRSQGYCELGCPTRPIKGLLLPFWPTIAYYSLFGHDWEPTPLWTRPLWDLGYEALHGIGAPKATQTQGSCYPWFLEFSLTWPQKQNFGSLWLYCTVAIAYCNLPYHTRLYHTMIHYEVPACTIGNQDPHIHVVFGGPSRKGLSWNQGPGPRQPRGGPPPAAGMP